VRSNKEIKYFLFIGILTVLIDYVVYSISKNIVINITIAKALGFITGTVFAFFANRNITFKNFENIWEHLYKFLLLYCGTLIINAIINKSLLDCLVDFHLKIQIAFLVATSTSATINFIGMKYFVFLNKIQKKETIEKN